MSITATTTLPDGYADVPSGRIATVVTTLEMRAPPPARKVPDLPDGIAVRRVPRPDLDWYRGVFRLVGEPWLWFSRLRLSDAALSRIIHDEKVETWTVSTGDGDGTSHRDQGLLELDFRVAGECELAYFGVSPALTGQGIGRYLMSRALAEAWQRPIERFWVHTCTLDHPSALGFYIRSGFAPIKRQIEIAPDPRLDGTVPVTDAPQIPILR
ncbi:MAG: GNAT family N-acetyltransferase [Hyphomicrobiaceae bacterium]